MKVIVIHSAYKIKGGEDTVVSEEIKLLQSQGTTVEFLQFDNDKKALLKFAQVPFNIFSYFKTLKKLDEVKPDVVHIHNLHYAGSASVVYAVKRRKIPLVMTLHNYRLLCPSAVLFHNQKPFMASLKENFPWTAVKQKVFQNSRLLTLWLSMSIQLHKKLGTYKLCDRIIVLSEEAKNIFVQSGLRLPEDKIAIKPNFCADKFDTAASKANHFFYAGRLSEEKGIHVLLETFSHCSYKLKIAGNGPLKDKTKDYSSRYENIEFMGSLDKDEVYKNMQNCTAVVFPSVWLEGMPLTIIEAFGCGTPVISSEIGAMRFMIEDNYNGLFFEPGNEKDFIRKLNKWQHLSLNEKKAYEKNARETYDRYYAPEKNAKELLTIYRQVIAEQIISFK